MNTMFDPKTMNDAEADKPATTMADIRAGIEDAIAKQDGKPDELARFGSMVERNREVLRRRMLTNESAYQMDRVALLDEYRLKFQQLQHDMAEDLRALDGAFERQRAIDTKLFQALDAARID